MFSQNFYARFGYKLIQRGKFKRYPNFILGIEDIVHVFCPPSKVDSAMDALIMQYEELKEKHVPC